MVNPPTQPVADDALPGVVGNPTISDLPSGYIYGVTRYADIVLAHAFPTVFGEIKRSLEAFRIDFANEIATGGGGRAKHTARTATILPRSTARVRRIGTSCCPW